MMCSGTHSDSKPSSSALRAIAAKPVGCVCLKNVANFMRFSPGRLGPWIGTPPRKLGEGRRPSTVCVYNGPCSSGCELLLNRIAFQPESDADLDLKHGFSVLGNRAANVFNFEPVDVAKRPSSFGKRVADGLVNAVLRDTYHFD